MSRESGAIEILCTEQRELEKIAADLEAQIVTLKHSKKVVCLRIAEIDQTISILLPPNPILQKRIGSA